MPEAPKPEWTQLGIRDFPPDEPGILVFARDRHLVTRVGRNLQPAGLEVGRAWIDLDVKNHLVNRLPWMNEVLYPHAPPDSGAPMIEASLYATGEGPVGVELLSAGPLTRAADGRLKGALRMLVEETAMEMVFGRRNQQQLWKLHETPNTARFCPIDRDTEIDALEEHWIDQLEELDVALEAHNEKVPLPTEQPARTAFLPEKLQLGGGQLGAR